MGRSSPAVVFGLVGDELKSEFAGVPSGNVWSGEHSKGMQWTQVDLKPTLVPSEPPAMLGLKRRRRCTQHIQHR